MNAPRVIPDSVRLVQNEASDPATSAWVAANAGAGKTHVLAQRVIRLLLSGVEPARILCITFTKAAAANMANRVFDTLREWIALDDQALNRKMEAIGVKSPDGQRARARQLFALALETPGGLKVQTIHAFCTHLLHLFPFEANVAARFSVLDEASETQLLDRLTLDVLLAASAKPDTSLGRALAAAIPAAADQTFRELVSEAIRKRDAISAWIAAAGGVEPAIADLSRTLGVDPQDSSESVNAEFFDASPITASELPAVVAALREGSKTDQDQSERFRTLASLTGEERLQAYLTIFCTATLEPRKNIVTKTLQSNHPALFQRLLAEQDRVCALVARRRAIAARDRTAALLIIADAALTRYRAEKDRRGLLDYDDLIDKALALLDNVSAAWVHYKLDSGIHHLLIDEAQDTSAKQWAIVRALVDEFTAGAGAQSLARRTLFAVGDEKQSIFSFQGAMPRQFDEMRRHFERAYRSVELEFIYRQFKHSFRSGENVLGAVDAVFSEKIVYASVTSDQDGIPPHIALPDAAPGLVELWEPEKPADTPEIEGWDAPFDIVSQASPVVRLADRIAKTVDRWREQGKKPGDVLVLVRRRGALFEAIIRALKNRDIPVAGADRLVLIEHIAIMDLIALADALLLPEDDLALAAVLKSPLFGFDDEDLFAIAWDRGPLSLRAALARKPEKKFADAAAQLSRLAKSARQLTPYAFYAQLLGGDHGRKRILARLGPEANDALDEFLNLALDYETRETPSLQGFVAWLRAAKSEIKRDMEMARDEVRVMTVHGAKGLEAPIVILADTTTPPQGWHPPRLLMLAGPPEKLVWGTKKENDVGPMGAAREGARAAAQDEYRRLLYVAMTRAAERLVVCGIDGERTRPEGCWYDLVFNALQPQAVKEQGDDGENIVWRYCKGTQAPVAAAASEPKTAAKRTIVPEWLARDAPAEKPIVTITPSGLLEDDQVAAAFAPTGADRKKALARGTLIHRLMQSLPDIPRDRRMEAARQFLARRSDDFTQAERDEIAASMIALLDDPRFADLFAAGSRAEVPIVGRLPRTGQAPLPVSGQVDRLVVTQKAVLIADYKTNRPAPRRLEEVPPAYLRQLALYRGLLDLIYPGKTIRAALVWTEAVDLMEVPSELLDSILGAMNAG